MILHLDSRFFYERTIRSLTYAAPFAAPLAYTGLGLLLIANRMVDARSRDWPMWILLLALGGFIGNFVLSLTDHAQNAFFSPMEWLPVVTGAFAIGSLIVPFLVEVTASYLRPCAAVLGIQAVVGVIGFGFHLSSVVHQPAATWFEKILSGAANGAAAVSQPLRARRNRAVGAGGAEDRGDRREKPRVFSAISACSALNMACLTGLRYLRPLERLPRLRCC